jgi:uncharacterized protein (UPF0276 family)
VATLIEWDTHIPAYATLREQAQRAEAILTDNCAVSNEVAA